MKTFRSFIAESKNTHLEHLEDAIFLSGTSGITAAVAVIREVLRVLHGNSKGKTFVSVKWDGAPSIICGEDPKTKKFFVATKSLFNKTPKVNYTAADIARNHGSSGVAAKLEAALSALKPLGIKGILQGDLLFTKGDVKTKTIEGVSYYTFQPNTIMYAIPVDSALGARVAGADLGVVFHTQYKGKDIPSLSASFGPNVNYLKGSSNVWIEDATFTDATGAATMSAAETAALETQLSEISAAKSDGDLTKALRVIHSDPRVNELVKRYFNAQVRAGADLGTVPGLLKFVFDQAKTKPNEALVSKFRANASGIKKAFALHKRIATAKNIIIGKMNQVRSIGAFYPTDTGFRVANPEGFVAVASKGVYKLVDRLEFSRQNFNAVKNW